MRGMIKNEIGNRYGPWVVIRRIEPNYPINCTVKWLCKCMHCGAEKIYIGNRLRFNGYAHTCKWCGGR